MSANVAVIYSEGGVELRQVAEAFGEAAVELSARVRLLRVPGDDGPAEHPQATSADLEWADAIAFGTPAAPGAPAPALMAFIEATKPLWESARLFDKVVTIFTDEPERFELHSVIHPVYEALYHWGAVIVGPRGYELELDARGRERDADGGDGLSGPRLRTARYRGRRLTAIAGVLAAERVRRSRLEL